MARLAAFDWPGNVRQLRNLVRQIVLAGRDGEPGMWLQAERLFQRFFQDDARAAAQPDSTPAGVPPVEPPRKNYRSPEAATEDAVRLGRQIAEGLAAAHARGILHRDLKLENVMVTAEGHAKILDFGLARRLDGEASLIENDRVSGTFRSMSPEQARGLPLEYRSDLFSLGTLLYEMLSGRSPFHAGSTLDTLTRICTHRQPPLREINAAVPEPVSDLVDRLLEKEAVRRPPGAREVARALGGAGGPKGTPVLEGQKTLFDAPLVDTVSPRPRPPRSWRLLSGLAFLRRAMGER